MSDPIWEDPGPRTGHYQGRFTDFIAAVKEHPDVWARYPHSYKSQNMASVYRAQFPDFEMTTRRNDDGVRWDLYVKYIA